MREDWAKCALGDIAKIYNGNSINKRVKEEKYRNVDWGLNYIGTKDVQVDGKISYDTGVTIPFNEGKFKIAPKNCVLVCSEGGSAGKKTAFVEKEICFGNKLYAITNVYNSFDGKYIFYYTRFNKFFDLFRNQMNGIIGGVSQRKFNKIMIPLSPLVEQKEIVKKIEELFSSLDSGIADLKKSQDQLKIYRQAVLKKAFEGIKEFKPLKDCGEWKGGGTPSRQVKEYWENGEIPWVSSRDIKTKEIYDTERHITEIAIPNSSTKWIEKDSLLFVMRSGILRRIFPIAIAKTKLCVNQDIQTVSLDETWSSEYVYWFLKGNESDIRHSCSKDGTTVESIDANSLKAYLVPACSLKEQHQIVQEIESRLSVCDAIEKDIADSLEKAQALRQSILKKAFEGTLLREEEITACKQHKDYEPASVLLEKIKKEKKNKR